MVSKLLWTNETGITLLSTELNNLANDALAVDGSDYDNFSKRYTEASFLLYAIDFDAAPSAGAYFELHIIYKVDGTNYGDNEDGDVANPSGNANTLVGIFPIRAADEDQYIQLMGIPLKPFAFRVALKNKTGTGLTAVDTNLLKMFPYNASKIFEHET